MKLLLSPNLKKKTINNITKGVISHSVQSQHRDSPKQTLMSAEQKHPHRHTGWAHMLTQMHAQMTRISCRANEGVEFNRNRILRPVGVCLSPFGVVLVHTCVCPPRLSPCLLVRTNESEMFALSAALTAVSQETNGKISFGGRGRREGAHSFAVGRLHSLAWEIVGPKTSFPTQSN